VARDGRITEWDRFVSRYAGAGVQGNLNRTVRVKAQKRRPPKFGNRL
jgi:hypothetical protein